MQSSNAPGKIPTPWAKSGLKNTVPQTTAGLPSNQAAYDVGFPAITMNPVQTGGLPPLGKDFNGVLNAITSILQWVSAGGSFKYDNAFATNGNVGGYPKGAVLLKSSGNGFWRNTVENNSTNPDVGGAGWVDFFSGYAATGSNVSQFVNDSGYITASGFAANLNQNGYQKLPSGLIQQWGVIGPYNAEGSQSKAFPIAFPTAALNATCTIINPTGDNDMDQFAQVQSISKTNISVYLQRLQPSGGNAVWPVSVYWQAIGY